MYKRISILLFPIALLALIGIGIWGMQVNQAKNKMVIKAENQYQRAFHDLSYHMDKLHTELGNSLAVNSSTQDFYKRGLVNVWRLTSQAQSEINQLPLLLLPFNKTEEFLDHMAEFSYRAAVRDLSSKPISEEEKKILQTLYQRSAEIRNELQKVQEQVIAQNLNWNEVETVLASNEKQANNQIVDGFRKVDHQVGGYSELEWGPSMVTVFEKRNTTQLLGNDQTPEEIKQKVAQFLGIADTAGFKVQENGIGTEYNSYSVVITKPGTQDEVHMDFAKKGGQLIYFVTPHDATEKIMDNAGAIEAAGEFLEQHGYQQMRVVNYDEYGNSANIVFARTQEDVIIYPEKLNVKVALDDGEIIGLQATDYIYEHKERNLQSPKFTPEQAKKELAAEFKLEDTELAIIKNEIDEQVLCYQFTGVLKNVNYKIFINANTGFEEHIEATQPEQKKPL